MLWIFSHNAIYVVSTEGEQLFYEKDYLCLVIQKKTLLIYYSALNCLVFLPLVIFFTWSYINIALVIWRHQTPETQEGNAANKKRKPIVNHHFERKVRTFKVVIVLLLSFVLCRLPYWIFYIIRLATNMTSHSIWTLHFSFISLSILNCTLNPMLYNFLNESITIFQLFSHFIGKVLSTICFFANDDFEELTKYNPYEIKAKEGNIGTINKKDKVEVNSSEQNITKQKNCKLNS